MDPLEEELLSMGGAVGTDAIDDELAQMGGVPDESTPAPTPVPTMQGVREWDRTIAPPTAHEDVLGQLGPFQAVATNFAQRSDRTSPLGTQNTSTYTNVRIPNAVPVRGETGESDYLAGRTGAEDSSPYTGPVTDTGDINFGGEPLVHAIGEAATLGWTGEAGALASSFARDTDYGNERERVRSQEETLESAPGYESQALAANLATAPLLPARVFATPTTAALIGAVSRLGHSEGDLGQNIIDTIEGAAIGGGLGYLFGGGATRPTVATPGDPGQIANEAVISGAGINKYRLTGLAPQQTAPAANIIRNEIGITASPRDRYISAINMRNRILGSAEEGIPGELQEIDDIVDSAGANVSVSELRDELARREAQTVARRVPAGRAVEEVAPVVRTRQRVDPNIRRLQRRVDRLSSRSSLSPAQERELDKSARALAVFGNVGRNVEAPVIRRQAEATAQAPSPSLIDSIRQEIGARTEIPFSEARKLKDSLIAAGMEDASTYGVLNQGMVDAAEQAGVRQQFIDANMRSRISREIVSTSEAQSGVFPGRGTMTTEHLAESIPLHKRAAIRGADTFRRARAGVQTLGLMRPAVSSEARQAAQRAALAAAATHGQRSPGERQAEAIRLALRTSALPQALAPYQQQLIEAESQGKLPETLWSLQAQNAEVRIQLEHMNEGQ